MICYLTKQPVVGTQPLTCGHFVSAEALFIWHRQYPDEECPQCFDEEEAEYENDINDDDTSLSGFIDDNDEEEDEEEETTNDDGYSDDSDSSYDDEEVSSRKNEEEEDLDELRREGQAFIETGVYDP